MLLSEHGLTMSFVDTVGCEAPQEQLPNQRGVGAAKVLIDTGASSCYISEQLVQKLVLRTTSAPFGLKLANGSQAVASGRCLWCRLDRIVLLYMPIF